MALFVKATNSQAFLKAGILGFAGSGKTFTATQIAIGLHQHAKMNTPVFFIDTETGSDWVLPRFAKAGIEVMTLKSRAFADLVPAVEEAEKAGAILIIDSITHFWREITESYAKKKNRTAGLQFQDWNWLKKTWGGFTDAYVNSKCHIVMCGRAGYEYDYFDNDGKKELEKTGIKMKAETETGYEPSLLILMERSQELDKKGHTKIVRVGQVLKDRSDQLDGKSFPNPSFKDFLPHIKWLCSGEHIGVDTTRTSEEMIETPGKDWKYDEQQRQIVLSDIEGLLVETWPGTTKEEKIAKAGALKTAFELDVANWERIKLMDITQLKKGFDALRLAIRGELPDTAELSFEADEVPINGRGDVAPE